MKPRITVCRVCPAYGRLDMFGRLNCDEDTPGIGQWVIPVPQARPGAPTATRFSGRCGRHPASVRKYQ